MPAFWLTQRHLEEELAGTDCNRSVSGPQTSATTRNLGLEETIICLVLLHGKLRVKTCLLDPNF